MATSPKQATAPSDDTIAAEAAAALPDSDPWSFVWSASPDARRELLVSVGDAYDCDLRDAEQDLADEFARRLFTRLHREVEAAVEACWVPTMTDAEAMLVRAAHRTWCELFGDGAES